MPEPLLYQSHLKNNRLESFKLFNVSLHVILIFPHLLIKRICTQHSEHFHTLGPLQGTLFVPLQRLLALVLKGHTTAFGKQQLE